MMLPISCSSSSSRTALRNVSSKLCPIQASSAAINLADDKSIFYAGVSNQYAHFIIIFTVLLASSPTFFAQNDETSSLTGVQPV